MVFPQVGKRGLESHPWAWPDNSGSVPPGSLAQADIQLLYLSCLLNSKDPCENKRLVVLVAQGHLHRYEIYCVLNPAASIIPL